MFSVILMLVLALVFVYTNGFHDTANSIATVVATRALPPRQAIVLATVMNLAGSLVGTAVAATIVYDLVQPDVITVPTIIAALVGAIIWNLSTWWWGLPTSSSHALVGALCGAAFAAAHGNWGEIVWVRSAGEHWWQWNGVIFKVVVPMVASPLFGLVAAVSATVFFYLVLRNRSVGRVDRVFGRLQILSGGYIGFAHGNNDAQKTLGVVVLGLVAATNDGLLDRSPEWLSFLRCSEVAADGGLAVSVWLKIACAVALAAGTAAGGWRIIQTMGRRITELRPVHGFVAETTAATILTAAAAWGFPVSTTHTITATVAGVGLSRRLSALHMQVVKRILVAWLLTLPAAGVAGYLFMLLFETSG